MIRYERPLGDGETLSYEFYYAAGKTEVHPAIGRTAYLLHPQGVHRHWMTQPRGPWKLPKDYEAPIHPENPLELPLREAAWNRASLHLEKNRLQIRVNDALVLDEEIAVLPQGTIFGLFHYADKTEARLRNIKLTGPWPETLPKNLFEQAKKE